MFSIGKRLAIVGACMMGASFPLPQQAWAAPGDHIRAGNFTFIPSLRVGFGLNSNVFYSPGVAQTGSLSDQALTGIQFVLAPTAQFTYDSDAVYVDFKGTYWLRKYLEQKLSNADRFGDFDIGLTTVFFRKSVVGFSLSDRAVQRTQPTDQPTSFQALLSQIRNDLDGYVNFRFGPEMQLDTGGGWSIQRFTVPGVADFRNQNTRNQYAVRARYKWKFFPRTAVVANFAYEMNRWRTNVVETQVPDDSAGLPGSLGNFLAVPNSDFIKATAGLRGRITKDFLFQIEAGYGVGNYSVNSIFEEVGIDPSSGEQDNTEFDPALIGFDQGVKGVDGLLIFARAAYDFGFEEQRKFGQMLTLDYRKDFGDSYFTNYMAWNFVQLELKSMWHPKITSRLAGSMRFEKYRGEVDRQDIFLNVVGGVGFRFTEWVRLNVDATWVQRASSDPGIQYDNVNAQVAAVFTY